MSRNIYATIVLFTGLVIAVSVLLQKEDEPLRIGFVADLSSELGSASLNGSQLATDEINVNGGINGRRVELVARSNNGNQDDAWRAVQSLADADVTAIIGHTTSEMSYSTRELIEKRGIVMISPTTATDLLAGKDDNFLRIYPSASMVSGKLASYAFRRDLKRFAIIADQANHAYSSSWAAAFERDIEALGGIVEEVVPFDSNNLQTGFYDLVRQVNDACVDGVLILAGPMHTALICQQFSKVKCDARLFATEWSYSPTLISFGGNGVANLNILQTYLPEALDPKSVALRDRLGKAYNQESWFAPVHSYDAARMLFAALQRTERPGELKQALLSLGAFEGVQSTIKLDENGDAERIFFIRKISDGKVSLVAQL